jgi:hypothetical protein
MKRAAAAASGLVIAVAIVAGGHAAAERRDQRTTVAIWRSVGGSGYGGVGGGGGASSSAFVSHRREVQLAADGALTFAGVAAGLDPATVEVKSVTDPAGTSVVEQRYVANLANPEALLNRQIGKPITVVLAQGQVQGTLRAVSLDALVIQNKDGLEIVRRGEHVVDIKLGAAGVDHEPSLEWKLAVKKPGRHTLDVSYRTFGLSWAPEYSAVLDGDSVDFTAWATVKNDTGLELSATELTLVSDTPVSTSGAFVGPAPRPPLSFKVARPVDLPSAEAMQVELAPKRTAVKARRVAVFEAMFDQSASFPNQDCIYTGSSAARSEQMIELDGVGPRLPEGLVRVFARAAGGGLVVVGEDQLRVNHATGGLRVHAGPAPDVTGERRQLECKPGTDGRSIRERVELKIENKAKTPVDVVVREYMFRWSNWRIEHEDVKGTRAGPTAQEWRVKLGAGGMKTISYAVAYTW